MNNKDYIMSKMNNKNMYPYSLLYTQTSTGDFLSPKCVGSYHIGQFSFSIEKKPNWFHRTMMKLFFGIVWKDN